MLQAKHWENHLLDLAHAALDSETGARAHASDAETLASAYQSCEGITRLNSRTFYLAAGLLPEPKRRATHALYAFCRISDDLVDRPRSTDPAADLETWRQQVIFGAASTPPDSNRSATAGLSAPAGVTAPEGSREVSQAWADALRAFQIPLGYVNQLIDGLGLDLQHTRYETFAELARYCYGAACTVGLMSMHITGYSGREAVPYAIRLGVALQLTNILRDVGEDWRAGRLYLPLEELRAFGLSEEDVEAGRVDNRWRAFMRFQIARARRLYQEALPGVALLHRDGRFAIAAAGELYRGILDQIEANDYNVFTRRAALGAAGKLRRLPGIWLRARMAKRGLGIEE